ncbi:four helix bundle protein [Desulfonatronum parangueonense]
MVDEQRFGFEELDVWQRSVDWAVKIVGLVDDLQTDRKHYRLIEQLEAACTSVSMNIAEGKGRFSKKEFVHFLYISRGSLYETITLLEIFLRLGWIEKEIFQGVKREVTEIAKMLNSLIRAIKQS